MKVQYIFPILYLLSLPLFAQAEIAAGAVGNLAVLLNKPSLVNPVTANPLERNWHNVYLDSHMFTDQASFQQIVAVLKDIENFGNVFDSRTTKLRTSVVSREDNEIIVDITSITVAFIRFTITYRASVKILEDTDTRFVSEVRQLDSDTNREIRNYHSIYYVEEVMIDGKTYTYIRIYSLNDTHVGLRLPNIRNMIERNSESSNVDMLNMIIDAAKTR